MTPAQRAARRALLKSAAASGLLAAVARQAAWARNAPDYKALVCIFQQGGNDGENTLVRLDRSEYAKYASIRTPASGLNIPLGDLLPVKPRNAPALGFHPACRSLQSLFEQRRLAIVANMGMLAAPSTRAGLTTRGEVRPANLFSHSDQQRALQSADARGMTRTGWGGRIADGVAPANADALAPSAVALQQWGIFVNGAKTIPLSLPPGASTTAAITPDPTADAIAGTAMREILGGRRSNAFDVTAQVYAREGLASSALVTPLLDPKTSRAARHFEPLSSEVSQQLRTVAMLVEGRERTQLQRQVFHVRQGNYDTHGSQAAIHHRLLADLSEAVAAFERAMGDLGLGRNVTIFTLSDFGRTLKPAANKGTDHGWGNYAFVIGDAVRGGEVYGTLPTLALDGPDDLGNAGRWIPTTSLEQYAAPLARWLGIPEADLPYVLPNIGRFPDAGLRFMT
ncbi:MAG: DUF1501 domain-containing protein [Burkholderiales bacterium]